MDIFRAIRVLMLGVGLLVLGLMGWRISAQWDEGGFQVALPIVTAGAANRPPVPADDVYPTPRDTALTVGATGGVLANDSDPDGDLLTAVLGADATHGTLQLNSDGSFEYVPNANFSGEDSFTYLADDGELTSPPATVRLPVGQTNTAPTASNDSYATDEDRPLIVDAAAGVLANDSDPQGQTLSAALVDDVDHGALSFESDGAFSYVPATDYSGQDSFTYQASDGETASAPATVTIQVRPVNDAPQMVTGRREFTMQVVGKSVRATHEVVPVDFDRDGDLDAAASDYNNGKMLWFRNNDGQFEPLELDGDLAGAYPVGVGDVNSDGYDDILAAGYLADLFVWYRNDGGGAFTRFVVDEIDGPHSIVTADVDEDGDTDLVTSSQDANIISWYENDGTEIFTERIIDAAAMGAKRAMPYDLDLDGDVDILGASYFSDEVAWYENDGNEGFSKHIVDTMADGAYFASAADADGDGDLDLYSSGRLDGIIAMYRHDGAGDYTKEVVDDIAPGTRTVIPVDMDHDGDMDLVATSFDNHTIAWYENDGTGQYAFRPIDEDSRGAYGVYAVDFDFDGDMDVMSASKRASRVALYRQSRQHEMSAAPRGSTPLDATVLQATDPDDGPTELIYTLTEAPTRGELRRAGAALGVGDTFTQADVNAGQVVYVHTAADEAEDAFAYRLADGGEDGAPPVTGVVRVVVE